jgi:hypothetical protein
MDCNTNSAAKLVYSDDDGGGGGKGRLDNWRRGRRRSSIFNMFCWFCFSFSSDSDDDDGKRRDELKNGDGVVASMVSAENHFCHVKRLHL